MSRDKDSAVTEIRKARPKAVDPQAMAELLVAPNPEDPRLTEAVQGLDQDGRAIETRVVVERPLTLFLNSQEIVTMMTIADYPGLSGRRLPAEPEHAATGRRDHGDRATTTSLKWWSLGPNGKPITRTS